MATETDEFAPILPGPGEAHRSVVAEDERLVDAWVRRADAGDVPVHELVHAPALAVSERRSHALPAFELESACSK